MAEIKVPIQVNLPDDWREQIVNRLRNDPEAEWVEIVRCKDCKHYIPRITCVEGHYNGCDAWLDNGNEIEVAPDDYCSYAERKDGD